MCRNSFWNQTTSNFIALADGDQNVSNFSILILEGMSHVFQLFYTCVKTQVCNKTDRAPKYSTSPAICSKLQARVAWRAPISALSRAAGPTATRDCVRLFAGRPTARRAAKMETPLVGVRTGARHEDGRYTDMIWFRSARSPRDAGGFNEPNKTVVK